MHACCPPLAATSASSSDTPTTCSDSSLHASPPITGRVGLSIKSSQEIVHPMGAGDSRTNMVTVTYMGLALIFLWRKLGNIFISNLFPFIF